MPLCLFHYGVARMKMRPPTLVALIFLFAASSNHFTEAGWFDRVNRKTCSTIGLDSSPLEPVHVLQPGIPQEPTEPERDYFVGRLQTYRNSYVAVDSSDPKNPRPTTVLNEGKEDKWFMSKKMVQPGWFYVFANASGHIFRRPLVTGDIAMFVSLDHALALGRSGKDAVLRDIGKFSLYNFWVVERRHREDCAYPVYMFRQLRGQHALGSGPYLTIGLTSLQVEYNTGRLWESFHVDSFPGPTPFDDEIDNLGVVTRSAAEQAFKGNELDFRHVLQTIVGMVQTDMDKERNSESMEHLSLITS